MARSSLFIVFFAVLCTSSFVFCAASTEQKMMANLYKGVEDLVIPSYNPNSGSPTQVILFEFPGLAINRAEYDPIIWAAGGFDARQPDAVYASFVDRLPYYTGPTFVDSGATISDLWSHFMYQYIIPIVDDPIQTKKVNDARLALANGTLENAYDAASDSYAQAFAALVTFRSDCLSKQPGGGGVCSAEAVIFRERLKRKWFNLEVARRDIAAAEAKIIALQIQDLKNQFAEALYGFASNERVDMGASGFGNSYYLSYATPSNFWRWWPNTGLFDYSVYADGSFVVISPAAGATIVQPPVNGFLTALGNGSYSYRPNAGYTGTDSVLWTNNVTINGVPTQVDTFKSIQVIGTDVTIANTAFVTVSVAASSSETTASSFATAQASSSSFSAGIGWFSVSGSRSQSSSSSSSTTNTLSSDSKMTFSLARVAITRPWLDVSILSFYPVAIRNINKQGWSDGTVTAPAGPLQFKFKILPVAFLVARNIQISTTLSTSMSSFQADASASASALRVSFGPFFSGSTSSSQSQSSRDYHEQSSFAGGSISIRGPQVIGWVCTPLPPFPTADEDEVRKWEADQVKRQADIASGNVTTTTTK